MPEAKFANLSIEDKSHLEKFKQEINSEHKITIAKNKWGFNKNNTEPHYYCAFCIHSLKTYNDLLLDYAKRYKTEGRYEGIDNLFILCTSLTNMIQNINQYSEYCAMLHDKNNGINGGFLLVGFDKKSEQDLEVAMEVSKVIIRG